METYMEIERNIRLLKNLLAERRTNRVAFELKCDMLEQYLEVAEEEVRQRANEKFWREYNEINEYIDQINNEIHEHHKRYFGDK